MLNELMIIERGMRQAGIDLSERHHDVKDAAKKPTLHVFLDANGHIAKVHVIASSRWMQKPLWKIVEGQKNSFPYIQPKPLWTNEAIHSWKQRLSRKPNDIEKRQVLLELVSDSNVRNSDFGEWASEGMIKALNTRRKNLAGLEESEISVLLITMDRFLLACDKSCGRNPATLVREISHLAIEELKNSTSSDLIQAVVALLVESDINSGALFFDADGSFPSDLTDNRIQMKICH